MPSHGPIILINQIENNHFLLLAFSEDHKILSMFIYVPKLSFTPFENLFLIQKINAMVILLLWVKMLWIP
jgi:hypothetical protein